MRAPPEADTMISGIRSSSARRPTRTIFSPTTEPIEPPMNLKSITARAMGSPSRVPVPVRTASSRPAFFRLAASRSR